MSTTKDYRSIVISVLDSITKKASTGNSKAISDLVLIANHASGNVFKLHVGMPLDYKKLNLERVITSHGSDRNPNYGKVFKVLKKIASTSQTWPILWAYDDMANKEYFKWFVKLELASSIKIKNGIRLYNQDVQILFRILHNNKKIEADFSTTDTKTWLNSVYKYLANEKWVQNELIDPESQLSRIVRVELEYAKRNIQSKARSRAKKYDSQIRYSKRTTRHNNALQRVENERFLCVVASEPDSFKLILRALERYIRARSSSKI